MSRRFATEEQIIKAIDKCHEKAAEKYREAEKLDLIADHLFKYPEAAEDAKMKRLEASQIRASAHNLINKKAKKLGEKLSEFRTAVIPAVTDDTSVSSKFR